MRGRDARFGLVGLAGVRREGVYASPGICRDGSPRAAPSRASCLRDEIITAAPCAAKVAPIASPMPFDAPVIERDLSFQLLVHGRSLAQRHYSRGFVRDAWWDVRRLRTGPGRRAGRAPRAPARIYPCPRWPSSGRGRRGAALPRRSALDPRRLPRCRRVLRDQWLPDHVPAAVRLAGARAHPDGPVLDPAGRAASCLRCS